MANDDWMASTYAGKAAMCSNILAKIDSVSAVLTLTVAQVDRIKLLCEEYLNVYEYTVQTQASGHSVTEWRDQILNGVLDKPAPDPPAAIPYTAVVGSITGWVEAFREMRELIVAQAGYTRAIGEDLMIVKPVTESPDQGSVQPTIQAHGAQSGYVFAIVVSGREKADMWEVQIKQGDGDWVTKGSYTGKSADITITPTTPGQPEQIQVRVQLRKSNANYGQLSQIATVTVNP